MDDKILAFGSTTGTTGAPKRVPVTKRWLKDYQRAWQMWGFKAINDHRGILEKKWLQISGPLEIDRTASGLPVGMVSAISARYQSPVLKFNYPVPPAIGSLADAELRYYALLRLSISSKRCKSSNTSSS